MFLAASIAPEQQGVLIFMQGRRRPETVGKFHHGCAQGPVGKFHLTGGKSMRRSEFYEGAQKA